jgi:transposase-like protein
VQTSFQRRSRSTKAERRQLLQEYRRSGLTQREFAAEAGLGLSTLHAWLRREQMAGKEEGVQFVSLPGPAAGIAAEKAPAAYRIELPNRFVLEIPPGFRREEVAGLVEVLRGV